MFDAKGTITTAAISIGFALSIAGVIGWIMNLYKIITSGLSVGEWGGFEVARAFGVFLAPLGGVLGWF